MVLRSKSDVDTLEFADGIPPLDKRRMNAFLLEAFAKIEKSEKSPKALMNMRNERDRCSKILGFDNYESYWKSKLWKKIRGKVLKRDKRVCLICEGKATQVHHRSYSLKVLSGEDDEKLASLCVGCHNVVHWDDGDFERSMDEWEAILMRKNREVGKLPTRDDQMRRNHTKPHTWKRMSNIERVAWRSL